MSNAGTAPPPSTPPPPSGHKDIRADRETLADTRQWLATVETHVRDNLDIIYRALQTHSDMIATLNETEDSDEALDMVLESAAKIAGWWQDWVTLNRSDQVIAVRRLPELARDMYASYATYLHTKEPTS